MISDDLTEEIWHRLLRDRRLDDLPLARHEGRLDLRRLRPPQRAVPIEIRATHWRDLDLSGAVLEELRVFRTNFVNCRFDECRLPGPRAWSSSFVDCTFIGANLRECMLGGVDKGRRTAYQRVDFSKADMRSTIYEAAAFEGCAFRSTKLAGTDFQSSTFKDCVFEGEIRNVLFYRHGFKGERFPPNEMINVDFRRARLHDVAFRGLAMDQVMFPEDDDHVVIDDYPAVLERIVAILLGQGDQTARSLVYSLEIDHQWLVPGARRAINLRDLHEDGGRELVDRFVEVLGRAVR